MVIYLSWTEPNWTEQQEFFFIFFARSARQPGTCHKFETVLLSSSNNSSTLTPTPVPLHLQPQRQQNHRLNDLPLLGSSPFWHTLSGRLHAGNALSKQSSRTWRGLARGQGGGRVTRTWTQVGGGGGGLLVALWPGKTAAEKTHTRQTRRTANNKQQWQPKRESRRWKGKTGANKNIIIQVHLLCSRLPVNMFWNFTNLHMSFGCSAAFWHHLCCGITNEGTKWMWICNGKCLGKQISVARWWPRGSEKSYYSLVAVVAENRMIFMVLHPITVNVHIVCSILCSQSMLMITEYGCLFIYIHIFL